MIYFLDKMSAHWPGNILKTASCIAFVCMLIASLAGQGRCAIYKYVDEKGAVHVTDSYSNVPEKYRALTYEVRPDSRTYGYTPSLDEAIGSERFSTDAWYDYGSMPVYERWFLLARAGLLDIKPILKAMAHWIGLALFILAVAYFYIFKLFETPAIKGAMVMLVMVIVVGGLFYKYIGVVEGQSRTLAQRVRQMRDLNADRQRMILGILESVPEDGR